MTSTMRAPIDGPAEILCELSRRLELGYTRSFIRDRVAGHAAPTTLTALVETAAPLGLTLTAGRYPPGILDEIGDGDLPIVLHLGAGASGGFGLLVAVEEEGFRVWDSRHGARLLRRDQLAGLWSGVMVLIDRAEAGAVREHGRWLRRLLELLFVDWQARVELAGARGSGAVGAALLAGVAALATLAVRAQAAPLRLPAALLAGLSALGLVATFAMARVTAGAGGMAAALCGSSGRGGGGCKSVLGSVYARVAGVPVAAIGFGFFGAVSLLLAMAAFGAPAQGAVGLRLGGASYLVALPGSLFFVHAQVRLRSFCRLCMLVHGVVLAGAVVAALLLWRDGLGEMPAGAMAPAAVLFLLGFGLLSSSTAPHLQQAPALAAAEARLGRLLASPRVTLAELEAEPVVEVDGAAIGVPLGRAEAPIELTLFAHPHCPACGEAMDELEALLEAYPDVVRAAVVIAPLQGSQGSPRARAGDLALCAAVVGMGRLDAGSFFRLVRQVKRQAAQLAPAARVEAGRPLAALSEALGVDAVGVEGAAEAARGIVERADAVARRRVDGVPTLFVNGRRSAAPMGHVREWLGEERLRGIVGGRDGA